VDVFLRVTPPAPEALSLHRNLIEDVRRRALKGEAATAYLKKLLKENSN
jgi:hypothetical protein